MIITIKYRRSTGRRKQISKYMKNVGLEMKPNVLETLSIGRRRSIALIQVGNKRLLIGSTPSSINLLKSFPESIFPGLDNKKDQSEDSKAKDNLNIVRNMFKVKKESPA